MKNSFLNSMYIKPKWDKVGNSWNKVHDGAIIVTYVENGDTKLKVIENPDYQIYTLLPEVKILNKMTGEYDDSFMLDSIPIENVEPTWIPYKDRYNWLAGFLGKSDLYKRIKRSNDYFVRRNFETELHLNQKFFETDTDINTFYKQKFIEKNGFNVGGYRKAVFDIEIDNYQSKHDIDVESSIDPIYCISHYDFYSDTMYLFVWDYPERYKTLNAFRESVQNGEFLKRFKSDPNLNGTNFPKILNNRNTRLIIQFYEDEYDLIRAHWDIIHRTKPHFATAWNFTFDLLTEINRLRNLNLMSPKKYKAPEYIICHPEIPDKFKYYVFYEDQPDIAGVKREHELPFHQKWHWFDIPGYTTFMCAMSLYSNLRLGKSEARYALDDIAFKQLGYGKYDYSHITKDVTELPHKNFTEAMYYNIVDTWVLACLEYKNKDIDQMMYMSDAEQLRFATKKTLTNLAGQTLYYHSKGHVRGNNPNTMGVTREEYSGAIVADPTLNIPHKNPLFAYETRHVYMYVMDNDLTSMYPFIDIAHNIYKTTILYQITRIGSLCTNDLGVKREIPTVDVEEMMDNIQTKHYTKFGSDYLGLPDIGALTESILKDLKI